MELYANTVLSVTYARLFLKHPVSGDVSETYVDVLSPESEARHALFVEKKRGYMESIANNGGVAPTVSAKDAYDYDTDRICVSVIGWNFAVLRQGQREALPLEPGMVREFFVQPEHAWRRQQILHEMDKTENFIKDSTPTSSGPQA